MSFAYFLCEVDVGNSNLKNLLAACDVSITGCFVELREFKINPDFVLGGLVVNRRNFDRTDEYVIFVPSTDFPHVTDLALTSGDSVTVPVFLDFDFDANTPLIWLSDRCEIAKK
ncbi:hypothetical protein ACIPTP_10810 [Pectobacterium versatile]|uniref:hypothetical protein n=1 Tax=Pectobacterium versatile TaxID=2488639 RepID=UPI0037F34820